MDFPRQDNRSSPLQPTKVGCHFLLQGIFLTQGSNLCLLPWQGILNCALSLLGSHPRNSQTEITLVNFPGSRPASGTSRGSSQATLWCLWSQRALPGLHWGAETQEFCWVRPPGVQMLEWDMEAAPPHTKVSGSASISRDFLKSRLEGPGGPWGLNINL